MVASRRNTARRDRSRELAAEGFAQALDSQFLRALADPTRMLILRQLVVGGSLDVATIAAQLPQDQSVISRHLSTMHRAGILRRHKVERSVFYELDGPQCLAHFRGMLEQAERLVAACCPPASPKG